MYMYMYRPKHQKASQLSHMHTSYIVADKSVGPLYQELMSGEGKEGGRERGNCNIAHKLLIVPQQLAQHVYQLPGSTASGNTQL